MRRVLITGATRGIGLMLAEHYLEQGDEVIGIGRTPADLSHPNYTHRCVDVANSDEVDELFRELSQRVRTIDVLINNAGIASMNALALTPMETARRVVDTNLLGPFSFTRAAVRLMRGSGSARIVNFTSVAVPLNLEGEAIYAASKSAVETLTRIAARELAPFGITCNAVGPSPIQTGLIAGVPQQKLQALIDAQAIPRWAVYADVVNVVDFFLKPESSMVTGQVIYLGGVA
jgi:3-oxoacyl-[acyl-carrier protein] reductase